jgi:hypothetical protein
MTSSGPTVGVGVHDESLGVAVTAARTYFCFVAGFLNQSNDQLCPRSGQQSEEHTARDGGSESGSGDGCGEPGRGDGGGDSGGVDGSDVE